MQWQKFINPFLVKGQGSLFEMVDVATLCVVEHMKHDHKNMESFLYVMGKLISCLLPKTGC